MCGVCGCGQDEARIEEPHGLRLPDHARTTDPWHAADAPTHRHTHADGATHAHPHPHAHEHGHGGPAHEHAGTAHEHQPPSLPGRSATRLVAVEQDILARNKAVAAANRSAFQAARTLALNLVSSPGSGKTTLLVATLKRIGNDYPVAAIEGDQETTADADRIRATGTPAIQINTGRGCHLDADQIRAATQRLGILNAGILFIENVGNLVCPASFDLGEAHKVVIVSVTEGEDKPLKYAAMFAASDLMVITKCDLLPHLDFDVDRLVDNARRINPAIGVLKLSAKSGDGMDRWMRWLEAARALRLATD